MRAACFNILGRASGSYKKKYGYIKGNRKSNWCGVTNVVERVAHVELGWTYSSNEKWKMDQMNNEIETQTWDNRSFEGVHQLNGEMTYKE